MKSPSETVVDALDGQLFFPPGIRLESGANLYRAYPRDPDGTMPPMAAFVLLRSGEPVKFRLSDASELVSLVSVYLRGEPQRFEAGEEFSRSVWQFLHKMPPPDDYRDCQVMESEPEFAGAAGYPIWIVNLRLIREE